MRDYYQILGLNYGASKDDVKKAYRMYAAKFHPDKHSGDKFFEDRFREVLEAYEVLVDDKERAGYDSLWMRNFAKGSSRNYGKPRNEVDQELKREDRERNKTSQENQRKERKSKVFYTSKDIIVNGLYVYFEGKGYLLDDYDVITMRKDDSSNFVFLGIALIIVGVVTISYFIGVLFLVMGVFSMFHKEYIVILANERNEIPLIKGRKGQIRRIVNKIKKAKEWSEGLG